MVIELTPETGRRITIVTEDTKETTYSACPWLSKRGMPSASEIPYSLNNNKQAQLFTLFIFNIWCPRLCGGRRKNNKTILIVTNLLLTPMAPRSAPAPPNSTLCVPPTGFFPTVYCSGLPTSIRHKTIIHPFTLCGSSRSCTYICVGARLPLSCGRLGHKVWLRSIRTVPSQSSRYICGFRRFSAFVEPQSKWSFEPFLSCFSILHMFWDFILCTVVCGSVPPVKEITDNLISFPD